MACSPQEQNGNTITPSLPASARIMSISEIRYNIFQLVDLDSFERKKTLLALALTCPSFTTMALDLLWRYIPGLIPLLRCLPSSLWILNNSGLRFQRAMTSQDWTIFRKYNHRVRTLDMSSERPISTETWAMISCPPFPFPLLPNLTSLTWYTAKETFSCIRLFVTQYLTSLEIDASQLEGDSFESSLESILSSISILCPYVAHFWLRDQTSEFLIDTTAALLSWSYLSTVKTKVVFDAAILHLANLPSLELLDVDLIIQSITTVWSTDTQHSAFCALRDLSVRCYNFASSDAFFKKLSITPQRLSFTIFADTDFSRATILASMSYISDACACNALEYIQVAILRVGAGYFSTPFSSPDFQPFYVFYNLREFKFRADCKVVLDDGMLLQMAKSWPLLQHLAIYAERIEDLQYFTANAFVVLLQHCPHLTWVEMDVDWSGIDRCDISPEVPYEGFTHENLSRADFGSSRIDNVEGIAAFLSAIAPNLVLVLGWDHDYHFDSDDKKKYSPRWTAVDQLVKSFSVIGKRERERMRKMINSGGISGGNTRMGGECCERDA